MKRYILFLFAISIIQNTNALEVTINGLNYFLYLQSHEATLTYGHTCSGELDIPSEISYNDETFVVKSMFVNSFYNNTELTKVRIPKTIENILHSYPYDSDDEDPPTGMVSPDHMNPFRECTALEAIEVDEENPSFKSINGVLFSQDGVGHYYYLTNEYYGTGLYCYPAGRQQEAYSIPDGVEWIGANAFEGSRNLSTLTIPNSITHIYSCAFQNCNNLTDVYCYADNVPITWDYAFKDTPIASATLHVPAGSIEEYKTTSPWSGFGNIVALPDNNDYFYYYNGSKIPLTLNENKVVVSIPKECYETSERIQANVQVLTTIGDNDFDIFVITRSDYEQLISLDSWEEDERNVVSSSCYFVGRYNDEVAASPYLNVKIKKEQDIDLLNAYVEEYKLRFDDYKPLLELWYVLSVTPETEKDPLQVANELYETGLFAESEPDLVPLGSLIGPEPFELVTYTEGQMATIILPEEPEASKGKYYRLDRVEEGKIVFEQELHPQAHVPYIIVPNEDFSIDPSNMDLEGLSCDTASIGDVSFIGSYVSKELEQQEGCNIQLIDTTPDCSISFSEETGKRAFLVGALRAYLTWDDPYNQGGTRVPPLNKRGIVLRDYETGITSPLGETGEATLYDLQGRMLPSKPAQGIYIKNRQKVMVK